MRKESRVALIIPSTFVSLGLESVLEDSGEFSVCARMSDFADAQKKRLYDLEPDIVILDPSVFDISARKTACTRVHEATDAPVVALADGIQSCEAEKMYDGCFYLMDSPQSLLAVLHKVLDQSQGTSSGSIKELSSREKEILVCIARGMLSKEIADKFSISINTVNTHRKNISAKTGVKSVAGMTVYAILNNLIDTSAIQ